MTENEATTNERAPAVEAAPALTPAQQAEEALLDKVLGKPEAAEAAPAADATESPEQPQARPQRRANDPDYLEASAVLQRQGWPAKAIRALSRQEVLDTAEARRSVQAENDRLSGELSRSRQPTAHREDASRSEGRRPETPRSSAQSNLDLIDGLEPLLAEEMGDTGKKVSQVLKELRAAVAGREPDSRVESIGQIVMEMLANNTRRELQDDFPGLKDSDEFETVRADAYALLRAGIVPDMHAAISMASRNHFFDSHREATKAKDERLALKRANGTLAAPKPAHSPKATLSEKDDAALDAIFAGKGSDAIRAAYR